MANDAQNTMRMWMSSCSSRQRLERRTRRVLHCGARDLLRRLTQSRRHLRQACAEIPLVRTQTVAGEAEKHIYAEPDVQRRSHVSDNWRCGAALFHHASHGAETGIQA